MIGKKFAYAAVSVCIMGALPTISQSTGGAQQQIESHLRQAQEFLRSNSPEPAAREFAAIVALDPKNIDARGNLGVLLFFRGDYAKASLQLREALKLGPTLWKLQALLGMSEKRTGQLAPAQSDLEKAFPQLQEEKLRIQTGMELIEMYYGAGDLDKATGVVSVLRQLRPTDPDILYTAHRIYSDLADESMLTLSMAAPKSARMHQVMAHEMARQGNNEGAIVQYREALKIDPQLPGIHFDLAELLNGSSVAAGQEEAQVEYKAALAVNPFDAKSECRLGEIAAKRNDPKAAYAHYSRALELQPGDLDANLGLARALISMKQPEKAEPLLQRAVRLDPTQAIAHYRLAALYRSMGRTEDARRELADFQKYKRMKERLKEIYSGMRLKPVKEERPDPDVPN
jgi:tetratricopeptide (TPR) repeat protein